ncbi:MAG: hypothetical protein M3Y03_02710, partial [Verrucomicrobiota bacterium]|nr:hypothetical protein [Verrucomicrobiota bacterium]
RSSATDCFRFQQHWPRLPSALRRLVPGLVLLACIIGQSVIGPAREIRGSTTDWFSGKGERARKNAFIAAVPSGASVVAPLPYLSHLALRNQLYSLHYILKGLKTLSRAPFVPPPPTDYVLIDYADGATFDAGAGYYHPTMRTMGGRVIPSSDQLLHEFLRKASWESRSVDEMTILRRTEAAPATFVDFGNSIFQIGGHTRLVSIEKSTGQIVQGEPIEVIMRWVLQEPRESFPWLQLRFSPSGKAPLVMARGLCVPQAVTGCVEERWQITATSDLPAGDYVLDAFFSSHPEMAWAMARGGSPAVASELVPPVSLGTLRVLSRKQRDESVR